MSARSMHPRGIIVVTRSTEPWHGSFCAVMEVGAQRFISYFNMPNRIERFFGDTLEKRATKAKRKVRAAYEKWQDAANIVARLNQKEL